MRTSRYPISAVFLALLNFGCASVDVTESAVATTTPIAVLPFVSSSDDPDLAFVGEVLSEQILTALVKFDMRVLARSSSFQFKGTNLSGREIGKQLDIDQVLEGSVSKVGTKIRVIAQMIATTDGSILWAELYEREMTDLPSVRSDISEAIAWGLVTRAGFTLSMSCQNALKNLPSWG